MNLKASDDLELDDCGALTTMASYGKIILRGRGTDGGFWYLYSKYGPQTGIRVEMSLCQHGSTLQNPISLLHVAVNDHEVLAIACYECKNIKLVDLRRKSLFSFLWARKTKVVYEGVVYRMCQGESNRIFVKTDCDNVLELDTSDQGKSNDWKVFSQVTKIKIGFDIVLGMCYASTPKRLLIFSSPMRIWAVSCKTNNIMWQVEGKIFGKKICPHGLLFLQECNLVLVSDANNSRILVLDPKDGTCLRALGLTGMGYIAHLCLLGNQVVILHYVMNRSKYNISYLCLNRPGVLA